jgi:hypothetical protein
MLFVAMQRGDVVESEPQGHQGNEEDPDRARGNEWIGGRDRR